MSNDFPLTRESALSRWRAFQPQVSHYAGQRSAVTLEHRGVSRLSPAIRFGLLRPEEIVRDTLGSHEFEQVEKWLQEVCWRSYWKGWMEMRPQLWHEWRSRVRDLRQRLDAATLARCQIVAAGQSGVAIMDRFAHELIQTGYLHNHARMWWASFWIHVERLPWELGADFFFKHLLDADPASNTLSWRWVAGLQTAGKTYLVRRSNLERWCAPELLQDKAGLQHLDDDGVRAFLPTTMAAPMRAKLQEWSTQSPSLKGRIGIWLHAEDASLETSPLRALRPESVAAFTSQASYTHLGLSALRQASLSQALQDGLTRAGQHYACETVMQDASCTATALMNWAVQRGLNHVVAMAPTVGPVALVANQLRPMLAPENITLHLIRRPWDAEIFPLAQSGFFPFWEKTRTLLLRSSFPGWEA